MASTHSELSAAQSAALKVIVDRFNVSSDRLKKITEQFVIEMEKGLDHQGATSKV